MTEQITNKVLFHVTATKPYKQSLTMGQKLRVGDTDNPFFAFYENVRQYPITDSNGRVVDIMALAWLKHVRDGNIRTDYPILANIASEVATHYIMLCRELIMEDIRKAEFYSEPPSRQRCLYACDSLDEAKIWNSRIGDNGAICEIACTGTIHRADAKLLLGDSEPISITRDRARSYWAGEVGPNPEMETLFVGDAVVTRMIL